MDEFFEICVAGIMQKTAPGDVGESSPHGMRPRGLKEISAVTHEVIDAKYRILNTICLYQGQRGRLVYL
jgi:polyphosphate kinase